MRLDPGFPGHTFQRNTKRQTPLRQNITDALNLSDFLGKKAANHER
jgi:hypothetical protein